MVVLKNSFFYFIYFVISTLTLFRAEVSYSEAFSVPENTNISFQYEIAKISFEGSFKIKKSIFDLDKEQPENSKFILSFDLNQSSAGFFLATKAMLSKSVLYAKKHPEISFKSIKVTYANEQFKILGKLKIRGITKDVNLVVKPLGFKPRLLNSLSKPEFYISAIIDRNIFGANGYSSIVGNKINLSSKVSLIRSF
jgi:polyisoprenoid-binding protein YceI